MTGLRVTMLSGQSRDSGCWLRTQYIGSSLRNAGNFVGYVTPLKALPFMLDLVVSVPINTLKVVFSDSDIVIGVKPFPHVTIPLMVAKLFGRKVVVDIDDLDHGYRAGFISRLSKFMQSPFPKHCSLVTYHNSMLKKHIVSSLDVDESRMYLLDQGVDLSTFDYRLKQDASLAKNLRNSGEKLVVYTGHLNIASDLADVLGAFDIVLKSYGNVRLVVAGGGPMEGHFRSLAKKLGVAGRTHFTGYIPKESVAQYLSLADVCAIYYRDIPVNYYRCSMKLRECLAMQKAVVCNDVGDLRQFRQYTYQTRTDLREFASGIISVLEKGHDSRVVEARKLIRKSLDWNLLGKKFSRKLQHL